MENSQMSRTAKSIHPRMVFGVTLVAIGILFLLERLLPYRFHAGDFWPLALVFWGIARFSVHGSRGWAFSAGLMTLGVVFLLDDYYPFSYLFDWDNIWPLALIALGGYLITKNLNRHHAHESISDPTASDNLRACAFMGGRKTVVDSSNFRGGNATVALGGLEIDFRPARLSSQVSEVIVDVTTVMGGIEIIVPEDWPIVVRATPFLGGIEDKRAQSSLANAAGAQKATLVIEGVVLLGALEILSQPS